MHAEISRSTKPKRNVWIGMGLLLVIILASAGVGRSGIQGAEALSAFVTLAGVLAMAGLMSRTRPTPGWAWWASAGVMSVVLAAAAFAAPGHLDDTRATAWMLPWFVYLMGTTPATTRGWCATAGTRGGWIMVGTSLFVSLACVVVPLVPWRW